MNTPPMVGLGLWKIPNEVTAQMVYEAIRTGYRHLDSACDYGNEKETGEGIRRALSEGLCTREELWVPRNFGTPTIARTMSDLRWKGR